MNSYEEFVERITDKISVGNDLNTEKSTWRIVKSIDEDRIVVRYGANNYTSLEFVTLYRCYEKSYANNREYSSKIKQTVDPKLPPCAGRIIGMILVKAFGAKESKRGNLNIYKLPI